MQDNKKRLFSLGSCNNQQRFLLSVLMFFIPIIIGYAIVEIRIRQIPNVFSVVGPYLEENNETLEVAVFGSSQVRNSVNPDFIDKPSINLASSGQHHNTDFELLKKLRPTLPSLETVVFEVSFGHFEIPHNSEYYWKNSLFLEYYHVNIFKRNIFIADRLLFMAQPIVFSDIIIADLFNDDSKRTFNKYGFEYDNFSGKFDDIGYDPEKIKTTRFKILRRPNKKIFDYNVKYFYSMLDYCKKEGLKTVLITTPTYTIYNEFRNPDILRRRDSILQFVIKNYKDVSLLYEETDTIFHVKDFRDQNHLNPVGAEKFTKLLNEKFK